MIDSGIEVVKKATYTPEDLAKELHGNAQSYQTWSASYPEGSAQDRSMTAGIHPGIFSTGNAPGYESLAEVLMMAYNRAAKGKGNSRHFHGEPFANQQIVKEIPLLGLGCTAYQIRKKALEAATKLSGELRINELLDIIVYSAAGIIAEMDAQAKIGGE